MSNTPVSISISIVCFHTPLAELSATLQSLYAATSELEQSWPGSTVEIDLVDNSESSAGLFTDLTDIPTGLADTIVKLELHHGHGNIGYGAANNLIIQNSASQYHLVLNPDVQLEKNCLTCAITYLQRNPAVLLLAPQAHWPDGRRQYLCKRYPSLLVLFIRGFLPPSLQGLFKRRLAHYEMHELSETEASTDIEIASGCFMLGRTQAFQQCQGFDANFFLYFEDFDLSLRIRKNGLIAYIPWMKITHRGGKAANKGFAHLRMFIQSAARFFNKHGWRLS